MSRKNFKFNKLCKICSGRIPKTDQELRPQVEKLKGEGFSNREIIAWADGVGIILNPTNLVGHFKTHAPYVTKGTVLSPTTKRVVTQLTASSEDSMKAMRKVIAMGSVMIDNWWASVNGEDVDGPKMEVDSKLFASILKEEGRRAPRTQLDEEFEILQKRAIEGEVINGKSA